MTPGGAKEPKGALADAIKKDIGSLDDLKSKLQAAAVGQFGSGWGWLCKDSGGKLSIVATPNQDTPLMQGKTPILGVDVWEHAYFLKYQNRRPDYVTAWWNVVNWDRVAARFGK
jgi:Fe-Mn family superoxide dismutase